MSEASGCGSGGADAPAPLRLSPLTGAEPPDAFGAMLAAAHFGDAAAPRELLEQTRVFLEANPRADPWGSYLAWEGEEAVGICAFKFAPDAEGAVEIAYGTFPAHRGRGVARGIIRALVALAGGAGARTVFACTLPEENASNGALRREGFGFAGEVTDPEDGVVWRWERAAGE